LRGPLYLVNIGYAFLRIGYSPTPAHKVLT